MANIRDLAVGEILTAPSPATSGTTLVLKAGQGADMPTTLPYKLLVFPTGAIPSKSNSEKVLVTARSTDTLTIVRAQGETTAKNIAAGWLVANAVFTEDIFNSAMVTGEVPTGTINGSNTAFTLASTPTTGSVRVFLNGVRQKLTDDYTISNSTITFVTAPPTGSNLLVDYAVGVQGNSVGTNSYIAKEAVTGTINGTNAVFTTARAYIGGSLQVFVNGLMQGPTHVTETTPSSGTFTLDTAPVTGDVIHVAYQFNLNPSSNADTVDGIHASTTATANQLLPLNSSAKMPLAAISTLWLGTAEDTSSSPTFTTTETTILTLSVTITQEMFDSGRRLRLSAFTPQLSSSVNGDRARVSIYDGATLVARIYNQVNGGSAAYSFYMQTKALPMPSVGVHSFTLKANRDTGSGTLQLYAEANTPKYLEAEIV